MIGRSLFAKTCEAAWSRALAAGGATQADLARSYGVATSLLVGCRDPSCALSKAWASPPYEGKSSRQET